jgi:DNA-binding response OmpR family regulator
MKLLIIDDEPHIRQMMRLTLEAAGYDVDEAPTGEDGLDQFGDGSSYAAVLLDQKMPGLDGLETLKRLRERSPGVRIVMVTAFASIELAVDAMKLGATDFVRKPMTPETLRGAVAAAVVRTAQPVSGRPAAAPERPMPSIETLTLNGFRIERAEHGQRSAAEHVFHVTRFPDGDDATVIVAIAPEALARIERLTRRRLEPQSAFWRTQAERRLSDHLWSTGRPPDTGRLTVDDVEVEDIDLAAAWTLD